MKLKSIREIFWSFIPHKHRPAFKVPVDSKLMHYLGPCGRCGVCYDWGTPSDFVDYHVKLTDGEPVITKYERESDV